MAKERYNNLEDLPRICIDGAEDVLTGLIDLSEDIRAAMKEGYDPQKILMFVLDSLDYLKMDCTVPLLEESLD